MQDICQGEILFYDMHGSSVQAGEEESQCTEKRVFLLYLGDIREESADHSQRREDKTIEK